MKKILSSIINQLRQQATINLGKAPKNAKYGLNIQTSFPGPISPPQSNATVRYHSATGTLFQNCNAVEKKLVDQNISLSYKNNLPAQGLLAHSLVENGLLLMIPNEGNNSETYSIELEAQAPLAVAYILIIAQENSKGSIVIHHKENAPSHTIVNVICEAQSTMEVLLCEPQTAQPHYSQVSSTVGNRAKFKLLHLVRNSGMLQSYITTQAVGEQAQVSQNHIVFGARDNKHDLYSEINHSGAHSISELQSKIILRDQAHTIYRGMSGIEPTAQGCSSQQKEQTLLLNPGAKIDVVPTLAITNDTIQCTHSASISSLDAEQLFYLQSRGFSYEEAESLIIQGFYSDILKQFSNLALCSLIHDYISPVTYKSKS